MLLLFVDLSDSLLLFFHLHPPILKPNFYLALSELKLMRELDAPPPRQIMVVAKLFLQLQRLVARIGLAAAAPHSGRTKVGNPVVLHPGEIGALVVLLLMMLLVLVLLVGVVSGGSGLMKVGHIGGGCSRGGRRRH